MEIRGNMWIKDSQNADVQGRCQIVSREKSLKVTSLNHKITSPTDFKIEKLTGNRTHTSVSIIKEIDQSTPFLHKACCSARRTILPVHNE